MINNKSLGTALVTCVFVATSAMAENQRIEGFGKIEFHHGPAKRARDFRSEERGCMNWKGDYELKYIPNALNSRWLDRDIFGALCDNNRNDG